MELSAFTNLFQNLQNYVVGILNEDEILQQMGCVFLSENSLDIEYQIRDALNKQGMACVVMTPKATYQGHNGIQQTFTCDELTIQIVENPIINRARLKKAGLEHGTCLDVAKQASDRLAGPQGGYFGQFTTKRIQEAEQGGLLVCTATFGCTVYERLDAVISGDLSGKWVEVPFVRTSELSDYIDNYLSTHMPAIEGYLPLSGGEMSGDILFQPNNDIYWGTPDGYDGRINASTPGLTIYNDVEDQWRFKSSFMSESEYDVLRRMDLSSVEVPTKVSELSNDVGYTTDEDVYDIMQPVQDSITALSDDMKGYIPLSVDSPIAAQITGGNTAGWEFDDQNGNPIFKIDEYGTYFSKRADIYGELYYKNQALSDYIDGKLPSVPDKLSQLSNDVGYITDAALSDYLPLSGGEMTGDISCGDAIGVDFNGVQVANGEQGDGFAMYVSGIAKYTFYDTDSGNVPTPMPPQSENDTNVMRGMDVYAVLGDISALIHAT